MNSLLYILKRNKYKTVNLITLSIMNLIKEFSKLVNGYVGSSMLTNTEYPETIQKNAEECEKIADKHAIKFAEWCFDIDTKANSMQDLLTLFKNENK